MLAVSEAINQLQQKRCSKCEEIKDIGEFSKNKNKKDGYDLSSWCKKCKKKCQQERLKNSVYRKRQRDHQQEYDKDPAYQEHRRERRREHIKNINDSYIINLIKRSCETNNIIIKSEDISSDLINLWRERVIEERKIRDGRKQLYRADCI